MTDSRLFVPISRMYTTSWSSNNLDVPSTVIEILTDPDLTALIMLLSPKPIEMGILNRE